MVATARQAPAASDGIRWNAGGWFGSVVGGTVWMLVVVGFAIADMNWLLASVAAGCCGLTNFVAWRMWQQRERLNPYRSFMTLLALMAVTLPAVWFATTLLASPEMLRRAAWPVASPWLHVVAVLAVPAVMVWIYLRQSTSNGLARPARLD